MSDKDKLVSVHSWLRTIVDSLHAGDGERPDCKVGGELVHKIL